MSGRSRIFSVAETLVVAGIPVVCTFLYSWKLGIVWFVFTALSGSGRSVK
jgi:hypothetical protein